MDLRQVIFLGGWGSSASVQIRCLQMAERLGCDYKLGITRAKAVPGRYSVFICVKPLLPKRELANLARRGKVVWDILDELPPRQYVDRYIVSTKFAKELLRDYGRMEVIPHWHCNTSGVPNPATNRKAGWIGHKHWHRVLADVNHDTYFTDGMTLKEIVQAHRNIGIGLNVRKPRRWRDFHVAINSGIKLINCLGFGIPSVSAQEPAYLEFGKGCTIFTQPKHCAKWVHALQHDDNLYMELRRKCLLRAPKFHIDTIAEQYRKLLESL